MKSPHRDPLGVLLRQWADRNAPPEADAERLRRQVAQSVGAEAFLDLPPPAASRRRTWGWAFGFALGAAVAVLAVVALRTGERHDSPQAPGGSLADDVPAGVCFVQSELVEKVALLSAMQDVFAGRLAWIGEAGREVQLGLLPDAVSAPRSSAPLVVRVVVLARKSNTSGWRPVWQADVIAQDEEVVDLAAEGVHDGNLRLWMRTLPDGAIAVDADLAWKGAARLRSSFSGIQRTGVPQRVFSSESDEGEYQVYQTVARLPASGSS